MKQLNEKRSSDHSEVSGFAWLSWINKAHTEKPTKSWDFNGDTVCVTVLGAAANILLLLEVTLMCSFFKLCESLSTCVLQKTSLHSPTATM